MFTRLTVLLAGSVLLLTAATAKSPAEALFQSIRAGNSAGVRSALAQGADVNAKDPEGATPLMYAALYSDATTMRTLIERGADIKAANEAGATALHWSTNSLDKVRLLVEHGADVNTQSKLGKTALMIAASRDGAGPVAAYLVDHGAKLNFVDTLGGMPIIPLGGGGTTALIQAAKARDGEALAILLRKGADVNAREKNGGSALFSAIASKNRANAMTLMAHGADVNATMAGGFTPLIMAAMQNDEEIITALLSRGAKVDAEDTWGNTALMWAAYADVPRPSVASKLLDAGASLDHKNKSGETALLVAQRRGETSMTALLRRKGATEPEAPPLVIVPTIGSTPVDITTAVNRSLPLLQKGGANMFKERGCTSCHNNMLPAMAATMARDRGHRIDEKAIERDRKTLLSLLKPAREMFLENGDNMPDVPVTAPYGLMMLAATGYPADGLTDAIVHDLANQQKADGNWTNWAPRPPMEFGDIQATALSLHALQLYPIESRRAEFDARIRRAGQWLARAVPATTEEEVWRTLGLLWSKADRKALAQSVERLKQLQRIDGGWGQLSTLDSDAYATGMSLYALHEAGVSDATAVRGIVYLLRTQAADGTWHVKSRSLPFQPYFESGFPYGHDQWISMAGTSWAAIALTQQLPTASISMLH